MSSNLHSVVIGSALAGLLAACGGEADHAPAAGHEAATEHGAKPADAALVKTEDAHAAKDAHDAAGVGAKTEGAQTVVNGVTLHDCAGKNECKGQGGCKTATNSCAGGNECKGKGGCKVDATIAANMKAPTGAPAGSTAPAANPAAAHPTEAAPAAGH